MWYYTEGTEKKGPVSEDELKTLLNEKQISGQTNVWKQGMSGWVKASQCNELCDAPPPPPPENIPTPPLPSKAIPHPPTQNQSPALWNADVASLWSLLFTPIFGGFIVFKNWQSLGNEKKAKISLGWVIGCSLFAFLNLFLSLPTKAGYGILLLWYFIDCLPQIKYIKKDLQGNYVKKDWKKPLTFAAAGLALYIILIVIFFGFQSDPADMVRTGYLNEFGDSVTVGEVFDVVSDGKAEWTTSELVSSDSQFKTHELVEANWENRHGATVLVQFLVPKEGNSFELHGAQIGEKFIEAEQCIDGIRMSYLEKLQNEKQAESESPQSAKQNTKTDGPCESKIQELMELVNRGICVSATAYYIMEESFSNIHSMYDFESELSLDLPEDEWNYEIIPGTQQIGLSITYKKPTPECINRLSIDGVLKPNASGIVKFKMISTSHEELVERALR